MTPGPSLWGNRVSRRFSLMLLLSVAITATVGAQPPAELPAVQILSTRTPRTWPDSLRQAVRDSLAAARARWFRYLGAEVNDSTRQVDRLGFDAEFGFPRTWHTDDARNGYGRYVSDQGSGGVVVLFRVSEPVRRCRWWRRITRRCG